MQKSPVLDSQPDPGGSAENRRCVSCCRRLTVECQSEKRPAAEEEAEEEDEEEVVEEAEEVRVLREEEEEEDEWDGERGEEEDEAEVMGSSSPSNDSGEGSCSAIGTGMEHQPDATTQRWTATTTTRAEEETERCRAGQRSPSSRRWRSRGRWRGQWANRSRGLREVCLGSRLAGSCRGCVAAIRRCDVQRSDRSQEWSEDELCGCSRAQCDRCW